MMQSCLPLKNRTAKGPAVDMGPSCLQLLLLTAGILSLGLLPLLIDFGNNAWRLDFITQQIPFILETKRMLSSGFPWWSWNTFYGDNFMGAYSFYTVTSPFVWLAGLFPSDKILWGILLSLYLKTVCTSAFTYAYFRRMRFDRYMSCLGALMYTFSSFYICNLFYFHFCEPIMMLPLLLIAIEKTIAGDRLCYPWLALASFGVMFINFYFALSTFIMGLIYFLFRGGGCHRLSWSLTLKVFGSVILGVGIASFILIPTVMHQIGGDRVHSVNGLTLFLGYEDIQGLIIRSAELLRRMIMPTASEFLPEGLIDYGATSTEGFIPVFGWLGVAIYVIRHHRNWLSGILILLLVLYLTPLNGVFSLWTSPFYTRWLYGFVLMGCLATLYIAKEGVRISIRTFITYTIICMVIIGIGLFWKVYLSLTRNIPFSISIGGGFEIGLFVVNLACLAWYVCRGRVGLIWSVSLCSVLNMAAFSHLSFNTYHQMAGDSTMSNDFFRSLIIDNPLDRSHEDFRHRSDFISSYLNMPLLLNRPGISGFHSVHNPMLNEFERRTLDDFYIRTPTRIVSQPRASMAALMSVRDVFDFHADVEGSAPYLCGLSQTCTQDGYDAYAFEHYVPLGFAYDTYVTKAEFDAARLNATGTFDMPLMMLDNIVLADDDVDSLSDVVAHGSVNASVRLDSIAAARRRFTADAFIGDTRGFTARTSFDSTKLLFFSVPADPGFAALLDDSIHMPVYNANFGMMAVKIPAGKHTLRLNYFPPGLKIGIIITAISSCMLVFMFIYTSRRFT